MDQSIEKVSANELAAITGKTRQWICKLIRDGRIPAEKVGRTWMVDPLVKLPDDPRTLRKAMRLKRREKLTHLRKIHEKETFLAEKPFDPRKLTDEELDEDYTEREQAILKAIWKGWLIDANGDAFVRDDFGEVLLDGARMSKAGGIPNWSDTDRAFYRKQGGALVPSMLPDKPQPRKRSERDIQLEIDGWLDKGGTFDSEGRVTIDGQQVGQVTPWGPFERKWLTMSLGSMA